MTPERRKEIAQQAGKQRWAKVKGNDVEAMADRAIASSERAKLA